jgi:hypothetical protein
MPVVSLKQEREIKHRVGVVRGGLQRPAQTIDCSFGPTLLIQQIGRKDWYQASANIGSARVAAHGLCAATE